MLDHLLAELAQHGVQLVDWSSLDAARPPSADRGVRAAHVPGAHAAGGRPGAPVPVHLQPGAQPGGDGQRPRHRRAPLRPGEGAQRVPAPGGAARRQAVRAGRADHRRPAAHAVRGHGGGGARRLPRHPQRRPHARRGGGRRPAGQGGDGTAPPPLRSRGAAGGAAGHQRRDAGAAGARARPRDGRRHRCTATRSTSPACSSCTHSTCPS